MDFSQLQIIYEDNHLIAVNKPSGVLVQGDETGDTPLSEVVKQYIKVRYDKPGEVFLGVVHRLDRPVSGVVVFARTSKALSRMNALFQERLTQKVYWAVCEALPKEEKGHLEHYLLKDETRNITHAYTSPNRNKKAKKAELDYELISHYGNHCVLEVRPSTGRSHQIRVQLSRMGCPIRGDVKYGSKQANADASINLHARSLAFEHPVKREMVQIEAQLPENDQIWRMFKNLVS